MSQRASSSSASRASRKVERCVTSVPYPVGQETGLPLMVCPDCKQSRIIELRVKQDTPNMGRIFFKCPRNRNPKLCGFYKFQKEYLDALVEKKIITVAFEQIEDLEQLEEGTEDSDSVKDAILLDLEKKMEKVMWKMNFFFVCLVFVVVGVVVKAVVMT